MRPGAGVRLAVFSAMVAMATQARADSLSEALADAYSGNATIAAQRIQQRQTDEQLPEALAGWRPTVSVTGSIARSHQFFGFGLPGTTPLQNITPRTAGLSITQPIYHGGATAAGVDRAEASIAAGQAKLDATEQEQLLAAATAYLDAYRDKGVVGLNENLIQLLTLNQHDVQVTYNAGSATETDTSQAAARLEGAVAGRLGAEARLKTSLARFREIVGRDAGTLDAPETLGQPPATEDEAIALALAHNPDVISARHELEAAQHRVDVVRAGLLPKVDGMLLLQHADDYLLRGVRQNEVLAGVEATVPLYEAGAVYAQMRAAHEAVSAAEQRITAAERRAREAVSAAWNALQAARAQQDEFRSQIKANDVALNDTSKEVTAGTRTRLDVLNAEQELFGSRVSLVGAEHDTLLATYQLEAAAGIFTPSALGLTVPDYDPARHLDEVRGKWWGTTPPD